MGYETTVTGEIRIDPPMRNSVIRDLANRGFIKDYAASTIRFGIQREVQETDDGEVISISSDRIRPAADGPYRAYELLDELDALVASQTGHIFSGYLHCVGEDGEQWRIVIRDGRAEEIRPTITWPDMPEGTQ